MPGRAQSALKKKRALSTLQEKYMQQAIQLYKESESTNKSLSYKKVCKAIEAQCFEETKKTITLSDSTLHRRVHNGRSHAEAKEEQRWLNDAEEEVLINEVIYYAERGFPLDH
ncbi:MAG: hypothetical protein NXY57DRAFT_907430, partial [Lentinula lateritia]